MNVRPALAVLAGALFLPQIAAASPSPAPSRSPRPTASASAAPGQAKGTGFSFSDWHVSTGQLDANWQTGIFSTPGQITLTRVGSDISADHAHGNWKTHQATLTGHVVLHDRNGVLTNFAGETGSHRPATLLCDNLIIDGTKKSYIATGHVHFTQGTSTASADRAVMDGITHEIHLFGNVQLTQ